MASRVVNVNIHGQSYAIRSELEPQDIMKIAECLDSMMQLAARETASSDPTRVAVVASMNILHDLFRAQRHAVDAEGHLNTRAAQIEVLLDAVLSSAAPRAVNE